MRNMNIDNNNIRTVRKIYACILFIINAVNFDFICLIYHWTFAFIRFLENYKTIIILVILFGITREKHHHITLTVYTLR